jgi:hypothetical protein
LWWIIEARRPRAVYGKGRSAITEDEADELYQKYHVNKDAIPKARTLRDLWRGRPKGGLSRSAAIGPKVSPPPHP